jgi:hypothetical protein
MNTSVRTTARYLQPRFIQNVYNRYVVSSRRMIPHWVREFLFQLNFSTPYSSNYGMSITLYHTKRNRDWKAPGASIRSLAE